MGLLDLIAAPSPERAKQTLADLVRGPQNRLRGLLDDPAGFMGSALREGLGADDMERRWAWNQNRLDAMTGSDYTRASVDDAANRAALNLGLVGMVAKAGNQVRFSDDLRGAYGGQTNHTMTASIGGKPAGTVDYSVYDGRPHIDMIKTFPEYQRQGVGTEIARELQRKFPKQEISWGMMTDDGSALFNSLPKTKVPSEFADKFAKLTKATTKRDKLIADASKFDSIANPTKAQIEAYRRLTDPLNDLHDEIYALESELMGKAAYRTLID